jgi:hypothetical protein
MPGLSRAKDRGRARWRSIARSELVRYKQTRSIELVKEPLCADAGKVRRSQSREQRMLPKREVGVRAWVLS